MSGDLNNGADPALAAHLREQLFTPQQEARLRELMREEIARVSCRSFAGRGWADAEVERTLDMMVQVQAGRDWEEVMAEVAERRERFYASPLGTPFADAAPAPNTITVEGPGYWLPIDANTGRANARDLIVVTDRAVVRAPGVFVPAAGLPSLSAARVIIDQLASALSTMGLDGPLYRLAEPSVAKNGRGVRR